MATWATQIENLACAHQTLSDALDRIADELAKQIDPVRHETTYYAALDCVNHDLRITGQKRSGFRMNGTRYEIWKVY